MTPPVTVICVPKRYTSRGYGAKANGDCLYLPFNRSVELTFADVPEKKIMIMLRSNFNTMADFQEEQG